MFKWLQKKLMHSFTNNIVNTPLRNIAEYDTLSKLEAMIKLDIDLLDYKDISITSLYGNIETYITVSDILLHHDYSGKLHDLRLSTRPNEITIVEFIIDNNYIITNYNKLFKQLLEETIQIFYIHKEIKDKELLNSNYLYQYIINVDSIVTAILLKGI